MIQRGQIYKCVLCGNMVSVFYAGGGELVCCGQKMNLLDEKTKNAGKEKHAPAVEKTLSGFKIKIGSIPHPMEEKHYIQWIEIVSSDRTCVKFLNPGDSPEAEFCVSDEKITVRAYCNLHGLWRV